MGDTEGLSQRLAGLESQYGYPPALPCYGIKGPGAPLSKRRISSWLKEVVLDAYQRKNLPPPRGVQGRQVRSQAASWAEAAGVDPQKISDAATWKQTVELRSTIVLTCSMLVVPNSPVEFSLYQLLPPQRGP